MSSSEILFKAAWNRISARLAKGIVDKAVDLSKKAKETPEQLKEEWEVLKDEILSEDWSKVLNELEQTKNLSSQFFREFYD